MPDVPSVLNPNNSAPLQDNSVTPNPAPTSPSINSPVVEQGGSTPPPIVPAVQPKPVSVSHRPGNIGRWVSYFIAAVVFLAIGLLSGWSVRDMFLKKPEVITTTNENETGLKKNPILVGGILPLSGDAASYGIPYQKVALLAQKEINRASGAGGRPIEILWEDGKCEGPSAKLAAEKLVNEKNVQFLIAGACSSEYLAAAPIAQAKKVISFSPSATSPQISKLGDYIFRTTPSDSLAGQVAAEYAHNKMGAKTAAIIMEDSDYARALAEVFEQNFTMLGGTIVAKEMFTSETTDFSTQADKIFASNPDLVYILPQSATPGVLLVSALKNKGIVSKLMTAEILLIRDTVAKQGKILEGMTGIEITFDENRPKTKALFENYKSEYGLDVNDPAYMTAMYDILYLIKEAVEKSDATPDGVSEYLYSLKNWDGAVGPLTFDRHGDPTFSFAIRKITGSQAVQIDLYTPTQQN